MTSFGTVLTAGYMSDWMRAWKQNANGKTYFLYDGSQPVMELSSSGSTLATNTFGPSGPLARTSNGRTLLYTTDVQGNVSQQINAATGAVVASYGFDAWGHRSVVTNDPTASSDPYSGFGGMVGYYTDWETGLELCGLRYYDSGTGRWLNRDPISYAGGVNLYEYCGNSPIGMSDRFGTDPIGNGGMIFGCLSDLISLYQNGKCQTFKSVVCRLFTDCICSLLAGVNMGLGDVAPEIGCLIGLAISILQIILDRICDSYSKCGATYPTLCRLITVSAEGCVGGLNPILGIIIGIGNLIEHLDDLLTELCKKYLGPVGGYIPLPE